LLVFSKHTMFTIESRTQLKPLLSLRMRGPFEVAELRVSADGAIIGVAEDYGVTILSRK
jgi:hypothetical protein